MLNNYYFIGHGNKYESYPILSGELSVTSGVEPADITYFFATTTKAGYRARFFLMKNQFNSLDDRYLNYTRGRILNLKNNVEVSSYIVDNSTVSSYVVNINDTRDCYHISNYELSFNWSRHFSLKSDNNLYLQANILNGQSTSLDSTIIGSKPVDTVNVDYLTYYLLLSGNNYDIEAIESNSNNIYEYMDQLNISDLSSCYISNNLYNNWQNKPVHIPISNYEEVNSLVSTFSDIFYYNRNTNQVFSNLVSISSTTLTQGSTFIKDLYLYLNETYGSVSSIANVPEINMYNNDLMNFTFDEQAYQLSTYLGNQNNGRYYTTLYKIKYDEYIPIQSSLFIDNIVGNFKITNSNLQTGWTTISQNNNLYTLGEWLRNDNYLTYTSGFTTTYVGGDLQVIPYTNAVITYPELIGVNYILGSVGSKVRVSKFSTNPFIRSYINTIKSPSGEFAECYFAIDPQSYTIGV